ncbi:hypothetical protein GCM10019059_39930 [Camelimonas fluminis]|uniref:Single-stranded DNA-binding protein n=1 Tax=Camelimonas fluminis TaxID=1576911 RepID=A0ABV7UJY5_9HYPH|nr:single-stranded DNA-binding protein [Camelimonas fluminis]GHE76693.1 hypothetical protein GCM10019059_39930 [Camelimonas fluminis]
MNICKISGALGKDPEIVRFEESGVHEATLTVATHRFKNRERITDWHTVVVKNDHLVLTTISPFARRGTIVLVEGELIYEHFVNSSGSKVRLPKIILRDESKFKILPGPDRAALTTVAQAPVVP